jgi:hypothetical protein
MSARYAFLTSLVLLVPSLSVHAQCTNTSLYPANAITPDPTGVLTTITGCSYQTEYSRITGIVAGAGYTFTISDGSYITVRQGTFNGAVVAHGPSPLTVTAPGAVDLFPHWTVNAACSTATACRVTTVQRLLDCTPPAVSVEAVNDCANGDFSLSVVVSNAGDASSLSFVYNVNGGGVTVQPGVVVGTYVLGPFASGALVDLTVAHGDEPLCNVVLNDLTNEPCTIESCGPDTYTFCYGNNENYTVTYQGASTWPLQLVFNSGNVSPSGNDALVIHDGLDDTAPVLFSGVGNAGNLTGVTVVSTNPDHALTLRFTSNGSFSCGDGGVNPPWNYTVACLDCLLPDGAAGTVSTDCGAGTFTVEVEVTDLGSAGSLQLANDAGAPATAVGAVGTYTAGPFPVGTPVSLSLVNVDSPSCTVQLGIFENANCPVIVTCDGPPVSATYCYTDNDLRSWLYQGSGTEPIAIVFSQGVIESVTWDRLAIYDGTDNTAPLLWQHTQASNFNLAGLQVASTGQYLYMEMSSDGSVSCGGGSFASWIWTVSCLDCTNPQASFEVVPDCAHNRFSVVVDVTDLGSAPALDLTNNLNGSVVSNVGLGTTEVGPFPLSAAVTLSLENASNPLCRLNSQPLGYALDSCIITACEPTPQTYCYANGDSVWFIYQSGVSAPITIAFSEGAVLPGDQILLYNGADDQAQLVYAGNAGGNVGGLTLTSNNPENALTLVVVSNGTGSCATGQASPALAWTVGCGLVGVGEGDAGKAQVYPNPAADVVRIAWPGGRGETSRIDLFDATGRLVRQFRAAFQGDHGFTMTLDELLAGRYTVTITTDRGRWVVPMVVAR